jgi:hypothetical protein
LAKKWHHLAVSFETHDAIALTIIKFDSELIVNLHFGCFGTILEYEMLNALIELGNVGYG